MLQFKELMILGIYNSRKVKNLQNSRKARKWVLAASVRLGHNMSLLEVMQDLSRQVGRLKFGKPVEFVYNPLDYAWEGHKAYLEAFFMEKEEEAKQKDGTKRRTDDTRFVVQSREVVLVGMNPGPYGMTQTGT